MSTPMLKQYSEIKARYPDVVLFYRMGDFYEMFYDDAKLAAEVLGLTLTRRNHGVEGDVPLAGFPYHQLDGYLTRMTRAGYRVAVCDQVEDPKKAKGIVRRAVTEVVSAGTTFSEASLNETRNNYLASVFIDGDLAGLAYADATTGEFFTGVLRLTELSARLTALEPSEILCTAEQKPSVEALLDRKETAITTAPPWQFQEDAAFKTLTGHFGVTNLKGFGLADLTLATRVAGGLVHYLRSNLVDKSEVLHDLQVYSTSGEMILDAATRRHLELAESLSGNDRATLFAVMNRARTAPGSRLLRRWLLAPLLDIPEILSRQEGIAYFLENPSLIQSVSDWMGGTADLQRLFTRLTTHRGTPREAAGIRTTLSRLPELIDVFNNKPAGPLQHILTRLAPLPELVDFLKSVLTDEPSLAVGEGKVIREGFSADLDELRNIRKHAGEWILSHQTDQRNRTGIPSLKIGYNRVFGYYVEITNPHKDRVPSSYIRKQTLTNAERYVTPELKEWEEKILHAEEKIQILETEIWEKVRAEVATHAERIHRIARALAELDVLCGLSRLARERNFVRPEIHAGTDLNIIGGRHPVVEMLLAGDSSFIANDLFIGTPDFQIMVLTGPNMAGKSTYLRQSALIAIIAQIGSYVPATSARIGIIDRIFTRIGAGDNVAGGESTFLVEMSEVANILRHATAKSLIILDEVGRGTSTYDGLSLAWAITEYLHENPKVAAKTLFATHYHELNKMTAHYPRIRNYRVEVEEWGDRVVFLHRITSGETDRSYGIEVARLAGLPNRVVERARLLLPTWEQPGTSNTGPDPTPGQTQVLQLTLFESDTQRVVDALQALDLEGLSPREALDKLFELKSLVNSRVPQKRANRT